MKTKSTLAVRPKAGLRKWITQNWHPAKVEAPKVDPALPILNEVQRSAEVFRYSVLRTEYWLSPSGTLREWIRLNLMVALIIGTPALVVVPSSPTYLPNSSHGLLCSFRRHRTS